MTGAQKAPLPIETEDPNGLPSWPMILLAGIDGAGKTIRWVEASGSDLIHQTYVIVVGEQKPHEYGKFPGARFKIVKHDGTYRDILRAIEAAVSQLPGPNGEPNLVVLESGTVMWSVLTDSAQESANARWLARDSNRNKTIPEDGITITHDLWNIANSRWQNILDALREHDGPSIITSRLKEVTVFEDGQPTKAKMWKPEIQASTLYAVQLQVQMRAQYPEHDNHLVRVNSLRYKHDTDAKGKARPRPLPEDWSFDALWRNLGLHETVGSREYAKPVTESEDAERARLAAEQARIATERKALLNAIQEAAGAAGVSLEAVSSRWSQMRDGESIHETTHLQGLAQFRDELRELARKNTAPAAEDARAGDGGAAREDARNDAPAREAAARVASSETGAERAHRILGEELAYQADVLGIEYFQHVKGLTRPDGDVVFSAGRDHVLGQRPRVIEALQAQGRASEAEAYARIGNGFAIELEDIFAAREGTESSAESRPREVAHQ